MQPCEVAGDNLFLSPFSIRVALAIAREWVDTGHVDALVDMSNAAIQRTSPAARFQS